jgi:hypothetical protein
VCPEHSTRTGKTNYYKGLVCVRRLVDNDVATNKVRPGQLGTALALLRDRRGRSSTMRRAKRV